MPLNEKLGQQTVKEGLHVPSGFCRYTVCRDAPQYSSNTPILYRGENVAETLTQLKSEMSRLVKILDDVVHQHDKGG